MIGLLIVAHGTLGESLIHCASHVMGKRPLYLRQLGVTIHDEPDAILPQGRDLVRFLDQGDGVLVNGAQEGVIRMPCGRGPDPAPC